MENIARRCVAASPFHQCHLPRHISQLGIRATFDPGEVPTSSHQTIPVAAGTGSTDLKGETISS